MKGDSPAANFDGQRPKGSPWRIDGYGVVANKGRRACMKQRKTLLYEELLALVFIGLQPYLAS